MRKIPVLVSLVGLLSFIGWYLGVLTYFQCKQAAQRIMLNNNDYRREAGPTRKEYLSVATTYKLNNLKRIAEEQSIVNLASEKFKSPLPTATQKVDPNETNVKSRNSEKNDIMKLSKKQIALEHATDPLPLSAVCTDEVFLIIAVISLPIYAYRRELIRQSYANSYSKDINLLKIPKPFPGGKNYAPAIVIKTVFIISQSPDSTIMNSVLEEARLRKDIVIGGTLENYRNLTLKTKLALKWSNKCKSKFFLKTDDDSFVNPVALVEWLKVQPQNRLYTGMCSLGGHPHRNKTSKW